MRIALVHTDGPTETRINHESGMSALVVELVRSGHSLDIISLLQVDPVKAANLVNEKYDCWMTSAHGSDYIGKFLVNVKKPYIFYPHDLYNEKDDYTRLWDYLLPNVIACATAPQLAAASKVRSDARPIQWFKKEIYEGITPTQEGYNMYTRRVLTPEEKRRNILLVVERGNLKPGSTMTTPEGIVYVHPDYEVITRDLERHGYRVFKKQFTFKTSHLFHGGSWDPAFADSFGLAMLLHWCDFVLSYESSILVEAILVGKIPMQYVPAGSSKELIKFVPDTPTHDLVNEFMSTHLTAYQDNRVFKSVMPACWIPGVTEKIAAPTLYDKLEALENDDVYKKVSRRLLDYWALPDNAPPFSMGMAKAIEDIEGAEMNGTVPDNVRSIFYGGEKQV